VVSGEVDVGVSGGEGNPPFPPSPSSLSYRDDLPDPTTADTNSRPVGFWLKEFIASRANRLGNGRKFGSVEGSKPFLGVDSGRLVGRFGRLLGKLGGN
jgi:hypothetical protein